LTALRTAERTVERWTDELTHWAHLASRRPRALSALGVTLLALIAAVVTVILMSFGGAFGTYATIHAQLPEAGASVALNSPVEYRDVTVGKVATTPVATPGGLVQVVLHIKPSALPSLPANVTATVAPISIFGNQYVVLLPPTGASTGAMRSGQTVAAVNQGPTSSVQTTLSNLDYLLSQLHPAQLFTALSALADSLQGQGASLGKTLVDFNGYLGHMLPLWPKVVADLQLLVPVSNQLTASTPDIVGALSNFSTTSQTITTDQAAVNQLLSGGTTFAFSSASLFADIQQPYAQLVASAGPFLQDLSQTPSTIEQILHGLDGWARTWVAAEANGPYLTLSANVTVHNVADLALAALGGPNVAGLLSQALGSSYVNPPTYTAADCPRYGPLVGQGCGGTTVASLAGVHSVAIPAEPAQQQAAATIAAGLAGGQSPKSSSVASLLLTPVLTHIVGS
jgi:phospholipid/cholesterol/gamma-HCH transport system substrate-binding protein